MFVTIAISVIFILALIIAIFVLIDWRNDLESKRIKFRPRNEIFGKQGERFVDFRLKRLVKENEYLLKNILLPTNGGGKTEIDSILITKKGIFCIEIKNWIGKIMGDDESVYWEQRYLVGNREIKKHRNPVLQNKKHCEILSEHLGNRYGIYNVVIFQRIEDGKDIDSNYTYDMNGFIERYKCLDDVLKQSDIDAVYGSLKRYQASQEELEEYARSLREKYKD